MELSDFVYFLAGLFVGLLLVGVLYVQERNEDRKRLEDNALKSRIDVNNLTTTLKDDGTLNWIIHNEYHYSLWLLGERLQYWPTKDKWRWRTTTYNGDVEAFVRAEIEKAGGQ